MPELFGCARRVTRARWVLAFMQDCQHGRCGCPTDHYDRLVGIDARASEDEASVRLRPRGQQLEVGGLRACIDDTLAHAEEKQHSYLKCACSMLPDVRLGAADLARNLLPITPLAPNSVPAIRLDRA